MANFRYLPAFVASAPRIQFFHCRAALAAARLPSLTELMSQITKKLPFILYKNKQKSILHFKFLAFQF